MPAGVARKASSLKPSAAVTLVMPSLISFAIFASSRFVPARYGGTAPSIKWIIDMGCIGSVNVTQTVRAA